MKNLEVLVVGILCTLTFLLGKMQHDTGFQTLEKQETKTYKNIDAMKLGAFSVSLSVKDLSVSKAFYENMGFTQMGGDMAKNYLIMRNEETLIGLFQGMFQGNILTFNPGWDQGAKNLESFDDVRSIQKHLKEQEVQFDLEADEKTSGPASFMLKDPDGNLIMVDQHR